MLQISNVDDGTKSEWNVNETHIIIPMIDGDVIAKETDKIPAGTITLNALDGGDQTILTNGLEHSFVIGLDRNLFETHANKSDFLVIKNSDLKTAYTLSYVDQDRNEILWESPVLKERGKPEWCQGEKAIFEVKDVLNWREELEKSGVQINLDDDVNKIDGEILIPVEETITEGKKPDTHYIVNYYPAVQNSDTNSILQTKPIIQNCVSKNDSKESKLAFKDDPVGIIPEQAVGFEESVGSNNFIQFETNIQSQPTKDYSLRSDGVSQTLPEKSLPLKKKAKMKTTIISSENHRSVLKQETVANTHSEVLLSERKTKHVTMKINDSSDSDEPLSEAFKKRKRKVKRAESISPVQEESQKESSKPPEEEITTASGKPDPRDMYELIENLRQGRMINASVWQTLHSGLKELNVDILKEMNTKREENHPQESSSYSAQLKAFALVLYFKQPAAFNHLAKVYGNGWPSLNVIKEWKGRMNNHQRPDFVGVQREIVTGKCK